MNVDGICKQLPFITRSYVLVCVRLLLQFVLVELQHCGKPIACICSSLIPLLISMLGLMLGFYVVGCFCCIIQCCPDTSNTTPVNPLVLRPIGNTVATSAHP